MGLFLLRRRRPALLAAWLSYLVILAPNLGMLRIGNQIAADRYSYIAMMGAGGAAGRRPLPILAGGSVGAACRRGAEAAASLGVILGLILLTRGPVSDLADVGDLVDPRPEPRGKPQRLAHNNLGVILFQTGEVRGSPGSLQRGPAARPRTSPMPTATWEWSSPTRGGSRRPWITTPRPSKLNPGLADAHDKMGLALQRQGRIEEALDQYAEALRLNPNSLESNNNRAMILATYPDPKYRDGRTRSSPPPARASSPSGTMPRSSIPTRPPVRRPVTSSRP